MNTSPTLIRSLLALTLYAGTAYLHAATPDPVTTAVNQYLQKETQGLPGRVKYSVGALDPRTQLTPCPALEVFQPNGARLWGRTTVGVRCNNTNPWTIYVPVQITVTANYLSASKPLSQGQILSVSDLQTLSGDLATLPNGILTEANQAIGKSLRNSVGAGQPLRADMLSAPLVIKQGQAVKLITRGQGFSATGDGIALSNAAEGQTVQVRTANGAAISGTAHQGNTVHIGDF